MGATNKEESGTTEEKITKWAADNGITLLRVSLGVIYLWFGLLKYFPNLSPIEDLSIQTAKVLTFGLISNEAAIIGIATLETLIGIGFLTGKFLRVTLILLLLQLIGAIAPLFIFSQEVFNIVPYAPTITGQYIIKDILIISVAIILGATIRGGGLIADPEAAGEAKKIEEKKVDKRK